MKLKKRLTYSMHLVVVQKQALRLEDELNKAAYSAENFRADSSSNDGHDQFFEFAMLAACKLFEFGDTMCPVADTDADRQCL